MTRSPLFGRFQVRCGHSLMEIWRQVIQQRRHLASLITMFWTLPAELCIIGELQSNRSWIGFALLYNQIGKVLQPSKQFLVAVSSILNKSQIVRFCRSRL
ncbi:protein of unknown function [Burkholderia multivorans]